MLPLFFIDLFDLTIAHAGLLAGSFALTNLIARPFGGWLSDVIGRKKTIVILLVGLAVGYLTMSTFSADNSLFFVIPITMFCAFFVTAGNGAVFAMVPIIKRRMTGQIAGQVGAYGNVGAVSFLTVLSFVSPQDILFGNRWCGYADANSRCTSGLKNPKANWQKKCRMDRLQ